MTLSLPNRAFLRKLHLWVALVVGFPLALVSALGLPVTYWGASDALFDAAFYGVGRSHAAAHVDFDRLGAAALAVPQVVRLKGISLQRDGQTAIAVVASSDGTDREVSLDPATGDVMGMRDPQKSAIFILFSAHTRLLLDRLGFDTAGRVIVMALAASMIGLLVSGLLLWWPLRWRWEAILPVVRPRHVWRDLHNKAGIYTMVPLSLAALSALLLSVPAARNLGSTVPPAMPVHVSSVGPGITLAQAARVGGAQRPGHPVIDISDIDDPGHLMVLTGSDDAIDRWIVVDRHTGRPMSVSEIRPTMPTEQGDPAFLINIHQGHRWGAIGQALFAVASIVPLGLYVTGLVLWLRKRRRANRAAPDPLGRGLSFPVRNGAD